MLGEGSFAWVYRVFDEKFERFVALKVLKSMRLRNGNLITCAFSQGVIWLLAVA